MTSKEKEAGEAIIERITEKRVTRNATYYKVKKCHMQIKQVLWMGRRVSEVAWVHVSTLSMKAIENYEQGIVQETATNVVSEYGYIEST